MSNAILTELIRVKRVVEVEAGEGRAAWSLWAQSSPPNLEGDASDRSLLTGWSERARVCVCACKAEERQRRKRYMCVLVSLPSHPVSLSRSPRDATTPNPTDRLRVISLSLLARSQIFIGVQPSRCTMWHQQSCATRTRPCGGLRDLEKMSQKKNLPFPTGCCSLRRAGPSNKETQTRLQQVSGEDNGRLVWKCIWKWLIPRLLVASLKWESLNSWIHICCA